MQEDFPIYNNYELIKIVLISTDDNSGGAAIAAYRLYSGLKLFNEKIRIVVKNKRSDNPDVIPIISKNKKLEYENELNSALIHQHFVNKNRTDLSNTLFSYPLFGYDFKKSNVIKNADIINLHWINFFLSLASLNSLIKLKKPIVWTLHDQWLITGGCHYTGGCHKYLENCANCPQLINDEYHLPEYFLGKKRSLLKQLHPLIITPSHWLADIIRKIDFFQEMRIEVIPNSIDTSLYINVPKTSARKSLDLPLDGLYLLFNVQNALEKRKGIHLLMSALTFCMDDPIFSYKMKDGMIKVICFGDPGNWHNSMPFPIIFLGKIMTEDELCRVYSAADVLLFPSIEDNLPNTIIEAMSCGTPTIAFNTGGIHEIIQNELNGYIIDKGSVSAFAISILNFIKNPEHNREMTKKCRETALNKFSLEIQAKKYLELYTQLYNEQKKDGVIKKNEHLDITFKQDYEILSDGSDIYSDKKIFEMLKSITNKTQKRYLIIKKYLNFFR